MTGGVHLHAHRWEGTGRPFVLVHGLASNARLWHGVAARLAEAGHLVVGGRPAGPRAVGEARRRLRRSRPAPPTWRCSSRASGWTGRSSPASRGAATSCSSSPPTGRRRCAAWRCVDGGWIRLQDTFPDWEDCAPAAAPAGAGRPGPLAPGGRGARRPIRAGPTRASTPPWPTSRCSTTAPSGRGSRSSATSRSCATSGSTTLGRSTPASRVPVLLVPADHGGDGAGMVGQASGRRRGARGAP